MGRRVLVTAGAAGIGKAIAAFAVFLASDAAKSISGQALSIDNDMQRN